MAYNRRNLLKRVLDVQNVVLAYQDDHTNEWIYERKIKPVYHISRRTFYAYLAIPAKRELKAMDRQLSLF
ncbi:hypothetical protein FUAX_41010 (plasmid) [Fulvitalea axinellae]|uniref:WYL domain-containing protein n=1 Tax=Fulvitalea axinellae TaxID=1182444 RepID=A0AAU9CHM2_9BACT|nr:hypothetical protein FUAX_41010 [Fulvitalea axinellae]